VYDIDTRSWLPCGDEDADLNASDCASFSLFAVVDDVDAFASSFNRLIILARFFVNSVNKLKLTITKKH
jgi:hypothetical protein